MYPKPAFFMDSLYAAVTKPHSQMRVIITLRADFYDRPLLHLRFGKLVQAHTEVVLPLKLRGIGTRHPSTCGKGRRDVRIGIGARNCH